MNNVTDGVTSVKKLDLSIIIVNYNLAQEIVNCLNSLLTVMKSVNQLAYEVIIVDNNSPDKQLQLVEKEFTQDFIHFYYLEKNVGFGKGCNFGFTKANGEMICFLNPDTILVEDIFTSNIKAFNEDHSIGIIGPNQSIRKNFFDFSAGYNPNILLEFFNLIGLGIFVEGAFMRLKVICCNKKAIKVNWVLGACLIIKAELFGLLNGFDPDFFMFYEEVDLCRRALNKGLKVIYFPKLKIHHIGSISGKKDYTLYTIRTYASKNIYLSKHFKSAYLVIIKFLLYLQLISQLFIWLILFPFNSKKANQKMKAFIYLIKNNLTYEYRD